MIEKTHSEISKQLQLMQPDTIDEYELVYINDGSKDKTLSLMKQMAQNDHHVRFISFSRNFGREGAILSGLKYATGDAVMLMDGDLQHPPALIQALLQLLRKVMMLSAVSVTVRENLNKALFCKVVLPFC